MSDGLLWTTDSVKTILDTPVFTVEAKLQHAEAGPKGTYYSIQGKRCVCIIAEYEGKLIMVRQWRHGSEEITAELPGGVIDEGETPEHAAARELEEESGFRAGKITLLGKINPNPALFNKGSDLHVCLAEELTPTYTLHPDADEVIQNTMVPLTEVIDGLGSGEYTHAFMGTALLMYLRHKRCSESI